MTVASYQSAVATYPTPFAVGDGVTTNFPLSDGDETILASIVAQVTKTDWQGTNYLLSPSPRTNQLIYSQTIGGPIGWSLQNVTTFTNNAIAPDGTNTATFISETAVTNSFGVYCSFSIAPFSGNTYSIFVKAQNRTACDIFFNDAGVTNGFGMHIDLTLGAVNSQYNIGTGVANTATVTPYPNGWYRVAINGYLGNGVSTAYANVYLENPVGTTNYAGVVGSGLYVWGAQVEYSVAAGNSTATPYIASTTYPQTVFDYTPSSQAPRTNLLPFANVLSNSNWGFNNCSAAANTTLVTPDQNFNAWTITLGSGNTFISNTGSITQQLAGQTICCSVFLNLGTYNPYPTNTITLWMRDGADVNVAAAYFDFVNTSVATVQVNGFAAAPQMTPYGNGWWRCSISGIFPAGATAGLHFYIDPNEGGSNAGTTYYVYNPQIEYGVYPTPFIPTYANPVTVPGSAVALGGGILTFGQAPAVGASLSWEGSYIYEPTAVDTPLWETTIMSQYANSPVLLQLISNMNQYINPQTNINSFYSNIWDIYTAQGYGLDVWGRIVGVQRVLNVGTQTFFGLENAGGPFNASGDSLGGGPAPTGAQALYSGETTTSNFSLGDPSYRTLILAKALANICNGSIPAINQILINLFIASTPGRTGNAYCTDNLNMTMTYTFAVRPVLTAVEVAIVSQSGVLPKPTGVSTTVVQI